MTAAAGLRARLGGPGLRGSDSGAAPGAPRLRAAAAGASGLTQLANRGPGRSDRDRGRRHSDSRRARPGVWHRDPVQALMTRRPTFTSQTGPAASEITVTGPAVKIIPSTVTPPGPGRGGSWAALNFGSLRRRAHRRQRPGGAGGAGGPGQRNHESSAAESARRRRRPGPARPPRRPCAGPCGRGPLQLLGARPDRGPESKSVTCQ
jgi:hypothetical protein